MKKFDWKAPPRTREEEETAVRVVVKKRLLELFRNPAGNSSSGKLSEVLSIPTDNIPETLEKNVIPAIIQEFVDVRHIQTLDDLTDFVMRFR